MAFFSRVAPVILLVVAVSLGLYALMGMVQQGGVMTTRAVAVAFLLSDAAIGTSMVLLLITRDRRAPAWFERRLPFLARWLWHILLGLTILCYASLAPTFLFLFLQLKK